MHDATGMRRVQRLCNVDAVLHYLLDGQRLASDQFLKGPALQKFHHDEMPPVPLPDIMDSANVAMV